jgi:pyruvate,water dikinase
MSTSTQITRYVSDILALRLSDAEEAGAKGANLGELVAAFLAVPPGFVLMRSAYLAAMHAGAVDLEIAALHREALTEVDNSARVAELCHRMQKLVNEAGVGATVRDQLLESYRKLGPDCVVAVRSSATGEDGSDASFAGMNQTVTNVSGEDALVEAVKRCWASLFTPRVITYRASRGLTADPAMAVVVQQMIPSEKAGVAFTADPSTGERGNLVIEAALGLGEVVVSGKVQPDTYVVDKKTLDVIDVKVGHQAFKIERGTEGRDVIVELQPAQAEARVLGINWVRRVAELAIEAELHFGCPQDVEWAIADGKAWLVQARPITTLNTTGSDDSEAGVLLRGLSAAPGSASGRVRILATPDEGNRLLNNEILVVPTSDPDWLPAIRRAAALVTETGGMTCHAAIVAREFRVPCVVGARDATTILRDGQTVTVDGSRGRVKPGIPRPEVRIMTGEQPGATIQEGK